jgi:hypothetical protein
VGIIGLLLYLEILGPVTIPVTLSGGRSIENRKLKRKKAEDLKPQQT